MQNDNSNIKMQNTKKRKESMVRFNSAKENFEKKELINHQRR
jgi:hypothetical protein